MLFAKEGSQEGVEFGSGRRRSKADRSPDGRRILRDRAMLILHRSGLSYNDIAEVAQAFKDEPITERMRVRDRIMAAKKFAEGEAVRLGLLDSD
jgi:hypothetical protein